MSLLRCRLLNAFCLLLQFLHFQCAASRELDGSKTAKDSLLWGAYRPNVYFGVRPRIPNSLITGLMWSRVETYESFQDTLRNTCEQHAGMQGYGWDRYDPRLGGTQTIHDEGNGIDITTEFVKFTDRGSNGGSWGARIKGTPRPGASPNTMTTVIFYVGLEEMGSLEVQDLNADNRKHGFVDDLKFAGKVPELEDFTLKVTAGKGDHPAAVRPDLHGDSLDRTKVHSVYLPGPHVWQAKNVAINSVNQAFGRYSDKLSQERPLLPAEVLRLVNEPGPGSLHLVQKTFQGAFEFDIIYSQGSAKVESEDIDTQIERVKANITKQFSGLFKPSEPFTTPLHQEFSSSLFSNLIGGIGYFHGNQMIDRSGDSDYEELDEGFWRATAEARARNQPEMEGPYELFTSIPSRPFFPRGFLWDEGFHLIPIVEWDVKLTLQILKSWLNTMDEDGWIPREQILGDEARSKVPQEFQTQYPHYANPPTLFFIFERLLEKSATSTGDLDLSSIKSELSELYPLLKRHYEWYRRTQRGEIKLYDRKATSKKEAYRWRGRTETHLLTSGLDDYPRATIPHPGELHVDLISWMGMLTRVMQRFADALELQDDATEYSDIYNAIKKNIPDLHWSEEHSAYCDATIDDFEESVPFCRKGYVSLFPFMLGLIDHNDKKLGHVLDLIGDKEELWSNHGIRSLSLKDEFYGTGENYWRSPVWMNMNYLIVKALLETARSSGPHAAKTAKLYTELRKNLVNTVFESWKETGFAWEQYDPATGKGQRTQHFTGWTSLIVSIMRMPETAEGVVGSGSQQVPIKDEL